MGPLHGIVCMYAMSHGSDILCHYFISTLIDKV